MLQQTPQQLIDILSISNKKFNDYKELTNFGYYSSFWDFLIDQFNYLNLFSNISECIQTFV